MSEKLCLQWNDFQDNVKSVFGNLRECPDVADVTLMAIGHSQQELNENYLGNFYLSITIYKLTFFCFEE